MKLLGTFALLLCSAPLFALDDQAQSISCNKLTYQRDLLTVISDNQASHEFAQEQRRQQLDMLLQRHCVYTPESLLKINSEILVKSNVNLTIAGVVFQDAMQQTQWESYYQLPERCRSKSADPSEFVWCSQHRREQKLRFLKRQQLEQNSDGFVSLVAAYTQ
ncbi:hypothetical protein ACFOEE_03480 [Pseudoalteromonas fenneropenaei]|uniref:DUF1311 domain-containing protein n=1 Tax=Pseudoalteromonas fenneropenaei TaxID=1737459 RepID=A0ABV7CG52_9GAMM